MSSFKDKRIALLPLNSNLEVIYTTVMCNINFSLGFCINKENLDEYINDLNVLLEMEDDESRRIELATYLSDLNTLKLLQ